VTSHSVVLHGAEQTYGAGRRLAGHLRPGDLLVLTGPLGAGKTTLTRGLGEGLGVRGPVTSPTFVLARRHPSLVGGPALLHVDAYRLSSADELWDLDLEVEDAVTVVEWGRGLAEQLAPYWLELTLTRSEDSPGQRLGSDGDERVLAWATSGSRWSGADWATALDPAHWDPA